MKLLAIPGYTHTLDIPEVHGMALIHHAVMGDYWLLVFEKLPLITLVKVYMPDLTYKIIDLTTI